MSPYIAACRQLNRARVPYVIVGVYGINLYSERAGTVISTMDCDFLIPPDPAVLRRALRALRKLEFEIEAGGEPFVGDHPSDLAAIVRAGANVRAHKGPAQIDLAVQLAGLEHRSLWAKHNRFRVEGVLVRVAPLADLIRSKELAGRPKDRLFLETYRHALKELLRDEAPSSGSRPRGGSARPPRRRARGTRRGS